MTPWDFKELSKEWWPHKYVEYAFTQFSELSLLLLVTSPLPFPSNLQQLNGFVCFEWQCSVQLRTSPSSPAGSPENCLEVSFFLEVAWLPAGREGGCLWSDEHFLGWPIHGWWAAHLARGSHGREAPVCTCVLFARWLITSHLLNRIFKPHLLFYFISFHYIFLLLT